MDTKLTLKLNQQIIENAKEYAAKNKISLSRIIENYLQAITSDKNEDDFEISPFVKSIATGKSLPDKIERNKEHLEHLLNKHK